MEYGQITLADGTVRRASRLMLGTMHFGGKTSEEDAFRIMDRYVEQGGNVLDTARVYGQEGASERTVGKWIRSRGMRGEIFLITKGGHPAFGSMHVSRLSPEEVRSDMARSLEALQLDSVDLYLLHRDDERLPVEPMVRTLAELVAQGSARAYGYSNWHASRIAQADRYALACGLPGCSTSEIQWSYVDFSEVVQDDTLVAMDDAEMAAYRGTRLPVIAYSCQCGGVFSCGYKADLSDAAPKHRGYATEENRRRYAQLLARCQADARVTPTQIVLRHITHCHSVEGYALTGVSTLQQLMQALEAFNGD